MNINRFKQLLESTLGNVKPLIMEQMIGRKQDFNKLIEKSYKEETPDVLKIEDNSGSIFNTYFGEGIDKIQIQIQSNFWEAFDEYFGEDGAKIKEVYIGKNLITRPK